MVAWHVGAQGRNGVACRNRLQQLRGKASPTALHRLVSAVGADVLP